MSVAFILFFRYTRLRWTRQACVNHEQCRMKKFWAWTNQYSTKAVHSLSSATDVLLKMKLIWTPNQECTYSWVVNKDSFKGTLLHFFLCDLISIQHICSANTTTTDKSFYRIVSEFYQSTLKWNKVNIPYTFKTKQLHSNSKKVLGWDRQDRKSYQNKHVVFCNYSGYLCFQGFVISIHHHIRTALETPNHKFVHLSK